MLVMNHLSVSRQYRQYRIQLPICANVSANDAKYLDIKQMLLLVEQRHAIAHKEVAATKNGRCSKGHSGQ